MEQLKVLLAVDSAKTNDINIESQGKPDEEDEASAEVNVEFDLSQ